MNQKFLWVVFTLLVVVSVIGATHRVFLSSNIDSQSTAALSNSKIKMGVGSAVRVSKDSVTVYSDVNKKSVSGTESRKAVGKVTKVVKQFFPYKTLFEVVFQNGVKGYVESSDIVFINVENLTPIAKNILFAPAGGGVNIFADEVAKIGLQAKPVVIDPIKNPITKKPTGSGYQTCPTEDLYTPAYCPLDTEYEYITTNTYEWSCVNPYSTEYSSNSQTQTITQNNDMELPQLMAVGLVNKQPAVVADSMCAGAQPIEGQGPVVIGKPNPNCKCLFKENQIKKPRRNIASWYDKPGCLNADTTDFDGEDMAAAVPRCERDLWLGPKDKPELGLTKLGYCMEITNTNPKCPGGSVIVKIRDTGGKITPGGIDLTPAAFEELTSTCVPSIVMKPAIPRVRDPSGETTITRKIVPCPVNN